MVNGNRFVDFMEMQRNEYEAEQQLKKEQKVSDDRAWRVTLSNKLCFLWECGICDGIYYEKISWKMVYSEMDSVYYRFFC